jgi:hypothetical protein
VVGAFLLGGATPDRLGDNWWPPSAYTSTITDLLLVELSEDFVIDNNERKKLSLFLFFFSS